MFLVVVSHSIVVSHSTVVQKWLWVLYSPHALGNSVHVSVSSQFKSNYKHTKLYSHSCAHSKRRLLIRWGPRCLCESANSGYVRWEVLTDLLLICERWHDDVLLSRLYREHLVGPVMDEVHCVMKWWVSVPLSPFSPSLSLAFPLIFSLPFFLSSLSSPILIYHLIQQMWNIQERIC